MPELTSGSDVVTVELTADELQYSYDILKSHINPANNLGSKDRVFGEKLVDRLSKILFEGGDPTHSTYDG